MYSVDGENAQLLLSYNDVYSGEIPQIETEIKKLNMHKSISIICELIKVRDSKLSPIVVGSYKMSLFYESVLKQKMFNIQLPLSGDDVINQLARKDVHIISLQMLLILLKKIIEFGNYDTLDEVEYSITDDDYKKIIELQLAVAAKISNKHKEKIDGNHFLYSTYHLNFKRNLSNEMLRMYYMLDKISQSKDNFPSDIQNEYQNYYSMFVEKYGYKPIEYSALLFWEAGTYYDQETKLSCSSCWRRVERTYESLKNNKRISEILEILSQPLCDFKDWANKTNDFEWDFSKFYEYPFLIDGKGSYISISDTTIINAFFEKVFWLIRNCFPKEHKECMAFFGRLFESYIQLITKEATNKPYIYIPEFTVGKRVIKSSDAYIQKSSNLLAIEAKGFSVLLDCMIKNEKVEKNNDKLFVDPVIQADTFLHSVGDTLFQDIKEIYVISLTLDNINAVPKYYQDIYDSIEGQKKCTKIKYYFNFSIEEYEMLVFLMEQDEEIFELLKEYFNLKALKPFSSFIYDKYDNIGKTKFMDALYGEMINEMKLVLNLETK